MEVFIIAANVITPHDTFLKNQLPETIVEYVGYLKSILPDFGKYYKPIQLRRTNNYIKSGVACGLETLAQAGIEKPDAIISATSLGSVTETEKLLNEMLDTDEGLLSPTPFIQSTHNIIGAQIAEKIKCYGYNVLYAHHTTSFEHALLDAAMQLSDQTVKNILVGGFDELTEENFRLKQHISIYKKKSESNLQLLASSSRGSIAGEGTAYFVVSNQPPDNISTQLRWINTLNSATQDESTDWLEQQVKKSGLALSEIDLVISGKNGDCLGDDFYDKVISACFPHTAKAYYKQLCGEFDTASAIGLWVAHTILISGRCPVYLMEDKVSGSIENILIYHQNNGDEQSVMIVSKK